MPVASLENSLSNSVSPTDMEKLNPRTTGSLSKNSSKKASSRMVRHDNPGPIEEEEHTNPARKDSNRRNDSSRKQSRNLLRDVSPESLDRREVSQSPAASARPLHSEFKKKDRRHESDVGLPESHTPQPPDSSEGIEYAPGWSTEETGSRVLHDREPAKLLKRDTPLDRTGHNEQAVTNERRHQQRGDEYCESITRSKKKLDKKSRRDTKDSDAAETDSYRNENMEKRRHKKSDKRKRDYDETSDSDSQI